MSNKSTCLVTTTYRNKKLSEKKNSDVYIILQGKIYIVLIIFSERINQIIIRIKRNFSHTAYGVLFKERENKKSDSSTLLIQEVQ